ncbi:MFS transporter [Nonomuraea recticatena]|uniref:MFS transporter n=1 Tax=Nonomuraea recticatena TaxID=46178 RepID=UPI00361BEA0E
MYISGFRYRGLTMAVPANVLALGMVSLVTDISSEMVTAVLPYYAVLVLGLSPLAYGLLDGLYFGVTAVVRLAAGHAADRWQRRKLVAGLGYALSAVCKLGLMAAGGSVGLLGAVVAADRTGKGLRTAPRDALISLSASPETQGQAFGVHRAMDTVGAFLGPLAAFAVLGATGAYDVVFVVSFAIAVLGVVLLVLYVREQPPVVVPVPAVRPRVTLALLREPRFRRICLLAAGLGLVTVSDPFVYLLLQKGTGIAPEHFPFCRSARPPSTCCWPYPSGGWPTGGGACPCSCSATSRWSASTRSSAAARRTGWSWASSGSSTPPPTAC